MRKLRPRSRADAGVREPAGLTALFPATARLRPAYLATAYIVVVPGRSVTLRIGRRPPPLRWGTCRHAALLTAANPASRPRPRWANLRAHRHLVARLLEAELRYLPAAGVGDAGDWPAEPSVVVFGLTQRAAAALGRRLRQNAIVHIRQGSHVTLVPLR